MSPRARIAITVIAAVGLVLAFFAARGSDEQDKPPAQAQTVTDTSTAATTTAETPTTETTPPAEPEVPVVRIVGGKPRGGVAKLEFSKGGRVEFVVVSDVADEVHVHGYDVSKDVKPGRRVRFSFPAKIDGRFEVELEDAGVEIAQLDVRP